ncbi:MAG: nuclease-like protein [Gammaproteobacteria bacterium]|nr:nuclease-like protein [Gammaproteobacteria bacterium]NNM01771.1 nuclease-like protein [Gammaproteobacteria bacterium]
MYRILAVIGLLASLPAAATEFSGLAQVRDDGSLRIRGRTVHLWGITIPPTREDCRSFERPPTCAPRAALALDFKVDGFVRCEQKYRNADQSVTARCVINYSAFDDGDDLAAYLLNRGWAVALPEAPGEYHLREKVARANNLGIWGLPLALEP